MRMRSLAAAAMVVTGTLLPAPVLGFTGIFRSAYTTPADSFPVGIATGDFDNDQALDAVMCSAASAGSNETLVLYGFNDGTLAASTHTVPLPSAPSGMLKVKIDNDDFDDLVVAEANQNAVVFLHGRGDADYFDPPGALNPAGKSPVGLASADMDGNHTMDLVVANEGDNGSPGGVTLLSGDGDGTFHIVQQTDPTDSTKSVDTLPAESGTGAIALGNIDTDPSIDVLALNRFSNSVSIFLNDGHGVLTPNGTLPTGSSPEDLALVDIDNDGKLDLIIAASNDDAVTVQIGHGDGTFATAQSYKVGRRPVSLAIDDVNDDGHPDILVANNFSGDVSVLLNRMDGTFAPARTYVSDADSQALALGDFNNDGRPDAVVAAQGSDVATAAVLRNRGDGVLHAVEDIAAGNGPSSVVAADVDGDGTVDAVVSGQDGNVRIFPGGADGLALTPIVLALGGRVASVAVADLNGDLLPDIIAVDNTGTVENETSHVAVLMSKGGGQFAAPVLHDTTTGARHITIGDFNGDKRPDVAVTALGADRTCQGGMHPGMHCTQDTQCDPGICTAPGKATVLLQMANGQLGPSQETGVEQTPNGIAAVDANCDGKDDLLVANLASNTVSVLRSKGDGTFTNPQTLPVDMVGQDPVAIAVADFDRDGTLDFAVADLLAPTGSVVHLLKGDCNGPYTALPDPFSFSLQARSIVARDFSGDQIVDLAVVNDTANGLYLLRGVGDGTMNPNDHDNVSRMPSDLAAGDFDDDGRYDAVTANNQTTSNNISVLMNCARDLKDSGAPENCNPFANNPPPGSAALRGDGNGDGRRSAADFVAVAREVMDGDGFAVEDIGRGSFAAVPGVDANGDGRVDGQDRLAVAHKIFSGA